MIPIGWADHEVTVMLARVRMLALEEPRLLTVRGDVVLTPPDDPTLRALVPAARAVYALTPHRVCAAVHGPGRVQVHASAPLDAGQLAAERALLGLPPAWLQAVVNVDRASIHVRVDLAQGLAKTEAARFARLRAGTVAEDALGAPRGAWILAERTADALWPPGDCPAVRAAVEACSVLAEASLKIFGEGE